jgi:hypothetical protein
MNCVVREGLAAVEGYLLLRNVPPVAVAHDIERHLSAELT